MSNSEQPSPGALSAPVRSATEPTVFDERDRIVILTPCYDWQMTTVYADAIQLCQQFPTARFRLADGSVQLLPVVAQVIKLPNDSHIDRARNSLLWSFEQTHYRLGGWMDADQPPEPEHIARFWQHLMRGVKIVTGLVALKDIVPTFVCNAIKGELPDPVTGLWKIKDGGTGAMFFRRDLLDEIRTKWPQLVRTRVATAINYRPDDAHVDRALEAMAKLGYSAELSFTANANTQAAGKTVYAYFSSGVTFRDGAPDWLSEDWMICHRCQLLGIPIYADVNIKIRHLGKLLFPPPPDSLIAAALRVCSGQNPPFDKRLAHAARDSLKALHASINDQSISILHATRRPEQALRIRQLWLDRAADKASFEYIFGVDHNDPVTLSKLVHLPHVLGPINPGGIVAPLNVVAAKATGRILVMAADDCEPPQDWDHLIREAFAGEIHEPRVLWTSDGYTHQPVITHPIMTRAFYEAQGGYFFCPEYPHLFCDTELTVRAQAAGQIIDARHIQLKHQHPMFTGQAPDALHLERNSQEAWQTGRTIFQKRNPGVVHPHLSQGSSTPSQKI